MSDRKGLILDLDSPGEVLSTLGVVDGWARGNYFCKCLSCDKQFSGDKRARQCLPCAVQALRDAANPKPPPKNPDTSLDAQARYVDALVASSRHGGYEHPPEFHLDGHALLEAIAESLHRLKDLGR